MSMTLWFRRAWNWFFLSDRCAVCGAPSRDRFCSDECEREHTGMVW